MSRLEGAAGDPTARGALADANGLVVKVCIENGRMPSNEC